MTLVALLGWLGGSWLRRGAPHGRPYPGGLVGLLRRPRPCLSGSRGWRCRIGPVCLMPRPNPVDGIPPPPPCRRMGLPSSPFRATVSGQEPIRSLRRRTAKSACRLTEAVVFTSMPLRKRICLPRPSTPHLAWSPAALLGNGVDAMVCLIRSQMSDPPVPPLVAARPIGGERGSTPSSLWPNGAAAAGRVAEPGDPPRPDAAVPAGDPVAAGVRR